MNPKELMQDAIAAARSPEPAAHDRLRQALADPAYLDRIDEAEDYQQAARFRLRVSRVVEALGRNPAPSARDAFAALGADAAFLAEEERVIALLQASAHVRPPPPALVAFWDAYCQPDDGFTPTAVSALVDNGSPAAIALLETKLADPGHEDDDKLAWLRGRVLAHRYDLPLLDGCEQMLMGSLPATLRAPLVEVLFDYKPGEWFRPANVVSPPAWEAASREARARLAEVGELALLSVILTDDQRRAVELTLQRIRDEDRLRGDATRGGG